MRNTKMRPLLTAAISAAALLIVGAGPASAAWSGTTIKWTGTVTAKKAGGTPVNCTFPASQTNYIIGDDLWLTSAPTSYFIDLSCVGGSSLRLMVYYAHPHVSGSLKILIPADTVDTFSSPYGNWQQLSNADVPFTNGTVALPSKLTFNNTAVGYTTSPVAAITLTGNVNVTTSTGGLITFS